jgi:signal transduction histidine kinase
MSNSSDEQYPQLISLAVHEFRTPASVVGGYLRMLQRDPENPLTDRQRKMVEEAEKSCARLVALIAELSDIGKLDAGLISLQKKPIDLFALLEEVAAHVHEAEDRDVRLQMRGEATGAFMNGDPARLQPAFDALFRAILREKAGPATVVVDRRRMEANGQVLAVVTVSEDSTVLDAYERPRQAFDEKRGGLGLALPLARRVFEGHAGRLLGPQSLPDQAGSDPVSRGSAIVELPLTE